MNDYVIHAKLKNGNLLRAILAVSPNVAQFCKEHGLSQSAVGDFINLKNPALLESGGWKESVLKLADILGFLPDELFVEEQQTVRLETNQAYIEISRQQALSCVTGLEKIEQQIDVNRVVDKLMANSTPREKIVIDCRYTQDMTLDETAEIIGVSRERVRQIEAKALRRARRLSSKGLVEESKALVR